MIYSLPLNIGIPVKVWTYFLALFGNSAEDPANIFDDLARESPGFVQVRMPRS